MNFGTFIVYAAAAFVGSLIAIVVAHEWIV